jgi:hypothetical protein
MRYGAMLSTDKLASRPVAITTCSSWVYNDSNRGESYSPVNIQNKYLASVNLYYI